METEDSYSPSDFLTDLGGGGGLGMGGDFPNFTLPFQLDDFQSQNFHHQSVSTPTSASSSSVVPFSTIATFDSKSFDPSLMFPTGALVFQQFPQLHQAQQIHQVQQVQQHQQQHFLSLPENPSRGKRGHPDSSPQTGSTHSEDSVSPTGHFETIGDMNDEDEDDDLGGTSNMSSKDARNAAERKRRARLNDSLLQLKSLVPALAREKKPTKAVIYKKAVEHFSQMHHQNIRLKEANAQLTSLADTLKKNVEELTAKLEILNANFTGSPLSQKDFQTLLHEATTQDGWSEVQSSYGKFGYSVWQIEIAELPHKMIVWQKRDQSTSISRTRASCKIDAPIEALVTVLLDLKGRKDWDSSLLELQTLGTASTDTDEIYYCAVKSPSGISNRDFVKARRFQRLDNGTVVVIERSTIHPRFPPRKAFVRGEVMLSGFVIRASEENPNSCYMTWISQLDLKGNLPLSVVNYLTTMAPFSWFDAFINQTIDCSGDLVHCYKTALLRIAMA